MNRKEVVGRYVTLREGQLVFCNRVKVNDRLGVVVGVDGRDVRVHWMGMTGEVLIAGFLPPEGAVRIWSER